MLHIIDDITGFTSESDNVVILYMGKPFYAKRNRGKGLRFNLPPGTYSVISGKIQSTPRPIKYPQATIVHPKTPQKLPHGFEIVFEENPNRCSVDLKAGLIKFDTSYKEFPRYVTTWILGHELGHYLYKGRGQASEKACDTFSSNMMLSMGYNPSQINAAIRYAISNNELARCRKEHNLDKLKDVQNRM